MLILHHARIETLDDHKPRVTALAIDQGRIITTGMDDEILAGKGSDNQVQDMEGRTIWPGLIDAHLHLEDYSLSLQRVDCETTTLAECLRRVSERHSVTKTGNWLLGHGWNQNEWLEGYGTRKQLDEVAPHTPVFLTAKSCHAAWVNTLALQAAGIDSGRKDPPGGRIGRDETGNPDGILFESAIDLVFQIIPEPTVDELIPRLETAQTNLIQMGLTGVHDFDSALCFLALQEMHRLGKLHIRINKSIPLSNLDHAIAVGLQSGFGNDKLWIGSIKMFADGALGPQTAAMLEPYENEPGNSGLLLMDRELLIETGIKATSNGFSIAVHAIGDRANHEVLNAFEQIRRFESKNALPHLRHRIEHVQALHPRDQRRLSELDIIASMQPIHATSDMLMADHHWGQRTSYSYAWKSISTTGAKLAFGSDAPVETPNPFHGLHAAVTRQRSDGSPDKKGWHGEQRIPLREALQAYTFGSSYSAGKEDRLGRLKPGYYADLIVLDEDPFQLPTHDLQFLKPAATMIGGKWVWQG